MSDLPEHLQFLDKSDEEIDQEYLESFTKFSIYDPGHFFMALEKIFGINHCASCRKWWLSLFIGASVGINVAYGPISLLMTLMFWVGYWYFLEKYSHHNNREAFQEVKGMSIIEIADQCGSDDRLYVPYFLAIVVSTLTWFPTFTTSLFGVVGWFMSYLYILVITSNKNFGLISKAIRMNKQNTRTQ